MVLAGDSAAGLVNLGNGDLNGGVVLGLDDAVGGRALAGDVAIRGKSSGSAHRVRSWSPFRRYPTYIQIVRPFFEGRLQIDDLATVVFHFDGWVSGLTKLRW